MWGRVLVIALVSISASAQFRIAPEHSRRLETALREALSKQKLACAAEPTRAFLDFAFRFEIGYMVHCPLREFGGEETPIAAYMRVQTAESGPVWFSESYRVPGVPNDVRSRLDLERDRNEIEFSGVIAAGEGEYAVDLVVVDRRHRLFHRSWKTKAFAHGSESKAPISMQPNSVEAVAIPDWTRTAAASQPLRRLTVLVDAAPIHTASTRLRAWDRAFLMEALSSVLMQLPSNLVRVVAFNLDQQREVFRTDNFDLQEAHRFSNALDELELGKISVKVLEQSEVPCGMLLNMLAREVDAERRPDAVVLLGPANRLNDKIPAEWVSYHPSKPPIFYLKYSPNSPPVRMRMPFSQMLGMRDDMSSELASLQSKNDGIFPDIIQHAAALHGGMTLNLHSPADLADALKKIESRLHPSVESGEADVRR